MVSSWLCDCFATTECMPEVCVRMHCATAVPCCATYGCVFFVTRVMTGASEGVGGARGISSLLHIYTGADADHDYAMMIMHSIFWPLYLRLADGCPYERRAVVPPRPPIYAIWTVLKAGGTVQLDPVRVCKTFENILKRV